MTNPVVPTGPDTWRLDTGLYRSGHTACYLLHAKGELAFIDCGASNSVPGLLRAIETLGFHPRQVRWILPTHVHLDHAGGAGRLLAACPEAVLAVHHRGLPHLVDPGKLQQGARAVYGEAAFERMFGTLTPAPQARCRALRQGDRLPLGDGELHFIETPGHANHHGCFFHPPSGDLFTGDAFGLRYPELDHRGHPFLLATTTPVAFDPDAWRDSLDRMLAPAPTRACLTHFGPLDHPERHRNALEESLEAHERIALDEERTGSPEGREERLEAALRRHLARLWIGHAPDRPAEEALSLLEEDIRLNAQGLAVWLARRARRREKRL